MFKDFNLKMGLCLLDSLNILKPEEKAMVSLQIKIFSDKRGLYPGAKFRYVTYVCVSVPL